MSSVQELFALDFVSLFTGIVVVLVAVKFLSELFKWFIGELGLETKNQRLRREEHELLLKTVDQLKVLYEEHQKSVAKSIEGDKDIESRFDVLEGNIMKAIGDNHKEIEDLRNERKEDVEYSKMARENMYEKIDKSIEDGKLHSQTIEGLVMATRETMCDRLNQKYKYYLRIGGMPEDEIEDFISFFKSYEAIGGNHSIKAKYEYCMNNLKHIPVDKDKKEDNTIQ